MSYYSITYQVTKNDKHKSVLIRSRDEVLLIVKQIQRGIVSIKWDLIHGTLDDFTYFSIIEQNYDQVDNEWECYCVENDWENGPEIIYKDPIRNDITNQIFNERLISSKKCWNIYLHPHTISVLWEYFPLVNNTKTRQLIEIIITAKLRKNRNILSYQNLEEVFEQWNFDKLKNKDFSYEWVRNTLKNKIKEIREVLKIDLLKLSTTTITIKV